MFRRNHKFHTFKFKCPGPSGKHSKVYLDGKSLRGVTAISFHADCEHIKVMITFIPEKIDKKADADFEAIRKLKKPNMKKNHEEETGETEQIRIES